MRNHGHVFGKGALCVFVLLVFTGVAAAKKPTLVKVRIDSTPPGANIYLDGKASGILGQTGTAEQLKLPPGQHTLLLELDGFKPLEQTVNLSKGQRLLFKLQLEPAHLEVKPLATDQSSRGGEIFIDGTLAGTVPTRVEISAGKHTIEVRRPSYLTTTEQVEIKAGENRQLLVALNPEQKISPTTGNLAINSPVPAEVTVDNQTRGPTPVVVDSLTPGDHLVEVRPNDEKLQPYRRNVRVVAGQQGRVDPTYTAVAVGPPVEAGVPVSVVPRNTKDNYVVTLGQAQSCQTPCSLHALPGRQIIAVAGPGSRQFRSEITIPNNPTQVTVQHFTLGKSIGGAITLAYGLPSLIASSIAADNAVKASAAATDDTTKTAKGLESFAYGSLAFSGATSALAAIITLSTIKLNRASVERLGQISALPRPRVRFVTAGINPTPDRTGALAGATFIY